MVENRGCLISHGRGPPVMEFTPLLIINLSNVNFRILELKKVINQEILKCYVANAKL